MKLPKTAYEVCTDMLERTRVAYVKRDFSAFRACFLLPNLVHANDEVVTLATDADLRQIFEGMIQNFDTLGVIDMHRTVTKSRYIDENTIEGSFISRHVLEGPSFGAETLARGFMRRVGDEWFISDHFYETDSAPLTRIILRS
ncbi:MAG: hypothetical protein AAGF78_13240 [Pseudomonadota bacterium]